MNLSVWAYVAIAGIFVGYSYWLFDLGKGAEIANQIKAEKAQLKEDAGTVDKLREKEKVREKIVIKWKTRIVKDEGCYTLIEPLPADHVDELRSAYDSITRSETDRGLPVSPTP